MDRFFRPQLNFGKKIFKRLFANCFFAAVGICLFIFPSCSNINIDIVGIQETVVFEYTDASSLPSMRFSAFAETAGDERRVEKIRIVHESSGMEWVCETPRKISGSGSSVWAGYTNFVPATGDVIPRGKYTFHYIDMTGEESEMAFTLNYPESLVSTPANMLKTSFPGIEEAVALYDRDGSLIYFGARQENWYGNQDIKQEYGLAEKIRICYRLNGGSIVCMLPEQDF